MAGMAQRGGAPRLKKKNKILRSDRVGYGVRSRRSATAKYAEHAEGPQERRGGHGRRWPEVGARPPSPDGVLAFVTLRGLAQPCGANSYFASNRALECIRVHPAFRTSKMGRSSQNRRCKLL